MMRTIKVILLGMALIIAAGASAQNFNGRDVPMIVNYSAGGPTDVEARLVAKFLSEKYLAGVHSIVVQNVTGAGGTTGVNQLGDSKDPYTISFFTWDPVDQLIQRPALRVNYNDLKFVAGFQQVSVNYASKKLVPTLARLVEKNAEPLRMGALSATNHQTTRMRLAFDLLGVNYDLIPGYRGLLDISMAMQQGDIAISSMSLPTWFASVKPNLVDTGIAWPLFQFDADLGDGKLGRSPAAPDIPSFIEVYREVKGADAVPSGDLWDSLRMLSNIMDSMYRTIFMSPNAPVEAVAEMRDAMQKLSKDPEFVAEYKKIVKTEPRILVGERGEKIIGALDTIPEQQLKSFKAYVEAAQK